MANNIPSNQVSAYEAAIAKQLEMQAQINDLQAKLAAKSAVSMVISDYGSGTVSFAGLGRNKISFFPDHAEKVCSFFGGVWLGSPIQKFIAENANLLRCQRVAVDYCAKLGKKWPQGKSKTDPEALAYQQTYNAGKALAMADPTLDVTRK